MRGLPASLVFAVAVGVLLQYGLFDYPILEDRAYLIYLGQAVLRGEPIYSHSYMAYPPLAPLLSAASMAVGRAFDLPTYLAPRFAGVLVGALSAVALYAVTGRATRSVFAGVLAGFVLAGFSQLARLCVSNLEPKGLVVLFGILTCAALQRRRWLLAGLAAGCAATCWQPAGLYALGALAVTAWAARRRPWPALLRLAAGGLAALLPTLAYLAATDGWWDFWQRAFVIPAGMRGTGLAPAPWFWLELAGSAFASELVFFVTAAVGWLWFAAASLRRGPRGVASAWLHPSLGGVPLMTLLWVGFDCREFGGPPDMLPVLPLLAFWTAWGLQRALAVGFRALSRSGRPGAARRFAAGAASAVIVASAAYAWADAFLYQPEITLPELRGVVDEIAGMAGEGGVVASFDASEVYVLRERASPNRFLSLNLYADPDAFARFIPLAEPGGCPGLIERIVSARTPVVVVKQWKRKAHCVKRLEARLLRKGYAMTRILLPERRLGGFLPDERRVRRVRWRVYRLRG